MTLALGSQVLTPFLLRLGLRWIQTPADSSEDAAGDGLLPEAGNQAIVIGAGPTGRHAASRIETTGYDVCVVDLSPINLHPFSQQGFRTIAGDATQAEILEHAHVSSVSIVVVCVPHDEDAIHIARTVRQVSPKCTLVVRCRYQGSVAKLTALGVDGVVSEEAQGSRALVRIITGEITSEDS